MASLAERLEEDMKTAMRAGDKLTLGVVRRARAAIKNAEIANKGPIDDAAACARYSASSLAVSSNQPFDAR